MLALSFTWLFQGKLRKIKEKYGDQDEEERRIRMEILAVSLLSFGFEILKASVPISFLSSKIYLD